MYTPVIYFILLKINVKPLISYIDYIDYRSLATLIKYHNGIYVVA